MTNSFSLYQSKLAQKQQQQQQQQHQQQQNRQQQQLKKLKSARKPLCLFTPTFDVRSRRVNRAYNLQE